MGVRMNRGLTYEENVTARDDVMVVEHGLKIPTVSKGSDYAEFAAGMRRAEREFTGVFLWP